jgi:nitrogen fixation/metabolism regulation signal transduction histidine kinase
VGTQDQLQPTAEQYEKIVEQVRFKVSDFGNIGDVRKEFAGTLMWVFGAGILLVVLQIVMMTVFFSHKLAGPVFRFEKACRNVINGDYNDTIYLRKGDQMLGLAALLNEAMKVSGERIKGLEAKVAELQGKPVNAKSGDDAGD